MPSHVDQHPSFTAFELDDLKSDLRKAVRDGFKDALNIMHDVRGRFLEDKPQFTDEELAALKKRVTDTITEQKLNEVKKTMADALIEAFKNALDKMHAAEADAINQTAKL
jgi:hypothetical protein